MKIQIAKVQNFKTIDDNRIEQITPFATKVQNLVTYLELSGQLKHLTKPILLVI